MGAVGDCFDNAMCVGFFATLEGELLNRRRFKTQVEARMAVFDCFYNPHRRHSALDYRSPCESERLYRDLTSQTMRSSTAVRTAWPLKAAGAAHAAAVSTEASLTLCGSLSNPDEERAKKLLLPAMPGPSLR